MKGGAKKKKQRSGATSLRSPSSLRVRAELHGNGSTVLGEADGRALWSHGCFGKGMLSRSRAERYERASGGKRAVREPPSAASPFHGTAPVRAAAPVLGVSYEPVLLTPEETLYLMHCEKCLETVPPKSAEETWIFFKAMHARIPLLFFAYLHYRRLGWVVRAGSKMGCDLVLYEDHPGAVHATHSVLVLDASQALPSWPELLGIGRVSENVRKTLVMCRVRVAGETLAEVERDSAVVEETVYRRWATNRTRDEGGADAEPDWSDD